jgi:hypothetical protein
MGSQATWKLPGKSKYPLTKIVDGVAIIDTIGEGAGVYSRLEEQGIKRAVSCKFSEGAKGLKGLH